MMNDAQITFYFSGNGKVLSLPINPGEIMFEQNGKNVTREIIGLGDINILRKPGLKKLKIKSYFPQRAPFLEGLNIYSFIKASVLKASKIDAPNVYVAFFDTLRKEQKPVKVTITNFGFSCLMAVNNFNHSRKAGEHDDIYYELEMLEWKRYGAVKLIIEKDSQGKSIIREEAAASTDAELGIVAIPSKTKITAEQTAWEIARSITGDGANFDRILKANPTLFKSGLEVISNAEINIPPELRKNVKNLLL